VVTTVIVVGVAVVAVWSAMVGLLWWQQDRMIFPGWGVRTVVASGVAHPDQRLELITPDGVRLVGALHRASLPSRGLLLVFGGNAEDADWRLRHFGGWLDDVASATCFYRGYGPSGGVPSEAALVADALLIHDHLVELLEPARVVVAGFSLGSGVAAQLARARPLAGLVLVTAFDSIEAMAAARYPFVPVRLLLRHPFRTDAALAGLAVPVAVIAADADHVVPPEHTRRLVDDLAQPVMVTWIRDADHVSLYDRPEYRAAFVEALDRLLAADQHGP
jgi:pimeloyl-ACP methyl ester carboxylesterase